MRYDVIEKNLRTGELKAITRDIPEEDLHRANELARINNALYGAFCKCAYGTEPDKLYYVHFNPKA